MSAISTVNHLVGPTEQPQVSPASVSTTLQHDLTLKYVADDPRREMNFGYPETSKHRTTVQTRLWNSLGHYLVIQIPFWTAGDADADGVSTAEEDTMLHVAQSPRDFIPIVRQLWNLHQLGFVHGDIRCFNMLMHQGKGTLIDFDFGGKAGEVRYPRGFVFELTDGSREGTAMELIEMRHDWYALDSVIFGRHDFEAPDHIDPETFNVTTLSKQLRRFTPEDNGMIPKSLVERLLDKLTLLAEEGWTCQAQEKVINALTKATGSMKPDPQGGVGAASRRWSINKEQMCSSKRRTIAWGDEEND